MSDGHALRVLPDDCSMIAPALDQSPTTAVAPASFNRALLRERDGPDAAFCPSSRDPDASGGLA